MKKKTCIIVCGATATGKTATAIELAKKYNTQIISADSRQCFKELNIGVAKPTSDELKKIRHYFINSHSVHDEMNAKIFEQYALNASNEIFKNNDVAVMAGGTGLYIKAFCAGLDDVSPVNENVRKEINDAYKKEGITWLQDEIKKADPQYFISAENKNPQRMMRALEVKRSTGKSILEYHSGKKAARDFKINIINKKMPKQELYERINERVDEMMSDGLLQEAESLFPLKHLNALQTVGYKELFSYLEGTISLDKAVDEIKKNTRHFAKRQVTWFNKYV